MARRGTVALYSWSVLLLHEDFRFNKLFLGGRQKLLGLNKMLGVKKLFLVGQTKFLGVINFSEGSKTFFGG